MVRDSMLVKAALTAALSAPLLFAGCAQHYAASWEGPFLNHLCCQFFHAGVWHLAANLYVLWALRFSPKEMLAAYALSVPATFASASGCVGFSSALYALMGIRSARARISPKAWALFAAANAVTAFVPAVAFGVHLAAFVSGFLCAKVKDLSDEYRRTCKRRR